MSSDRRNDGDLGALASVTSTTAQTHTGTRAADTQAVVGGVVRACDSVIVVGSGLLAYQLRHGSVDLPTEHLIAIAVGALLTLNYMHFARVYRFHNLRRPQNQIGPLVIDGAKLGHSNGGNGLAVSA